MLFQQSKNQGIFNQFDGEVIEDAITFSFALQTLKGLTHPMPPLPQIREYWLNRTQKLLKEEMGLQTEYYLIPRHLIKAKNVWSFV